jgi:hypothetical protein
MRKTLRLLPHILSIALVVGIVSCSKDGPAGPAGATGPAGPAGAAGAQGPAGPAGTANVTYSNWVDVTYTPVKDTVNGVVDTLAWVATIPAPGVTSDILTKGEVKVYLNAGTAADPAVFALPITDLFALTGVLNVNLYLTVGTINLYSTEDASTFTDGADKLWQYRYVLIPGGVNGQRTAKTIDWNNYNEVKAYLGLKN